MSCGANAMSALKVKLQSLREDLEKQKDLYETKCRQAERETAARNEMENELMSLRRKVQLVEDERDQLDSRLHTVAEQLQEASKVVDEYERTQRTLASRQNMDDDRMAVLEEQLRIAKLNANEAEQKYEEAARKLQLVTVELERAEERAETAEGKSRRLDSELNVVSTSLKSMEINENQLSRREEQFESLIVDLNSRLREADNAVEVLTRELRTKQTELDKAEGSKFSLRNQNEALFQSFRASCVRWRASESNVGDPVDQFLVFIPVN